MVLQKQDTCRLATQSEAKSSVSSRLGVNDDLLGKGKQRLVLRSHCVPNVPRLAAMECVDRLGTLHACNARKQKLWLVRGRSVVGEKGGRETSSVVLPQGKRLRKRRELSKKPDELFLRFA